MTAVFGRLLFDATPARERVPGRWTTRGWGKSGHRRAGCWLTTRAS